MAQFARVLYNYQASHDDELAIRFNEIVTVVNENTGADGWWEVKLRGKCGKIPSNYIELISEPKGARARCLYDHTFEEITGQYLPFKRGDTIVVLSQDPDGWWLGYADEQQGLFPSDYVELIRDVPQPPPPVSLSTSTSSLSRGTAADTSTSTSEPTTPDRSEEDEVELNPLHEALGEVLHDRDMSVVETLCVVLDPASSETMAKVVVPIFEFEGKIMDLCQATIDQEIKRTTKASTLFRTNSFASQVMRCYARLCGKSYLTNMLAPLIRNLNEMEGSVEIDPQKLSAEPKYKNLNENLDNLKRVCQTFVDAIERSLRDVPVALNYVSAALVEGVEFKFPEAVRVVIAGFFFLRFVCPAIVSPEGYDIIPKGELNARGRRGLVLVSKVVQNLANNVEFGNKEEFMKPMNDFVKANFAKINRVLDELPNIPETGDIEPLPRFSSKELTGYYQQLHELLSDNLEKIRKQFEETDRDKEVFQELALAVRQLGPTAAQIRQMESKHKELLEEDEDKKKRKKKVEKEEEKKKKEEEKKKKEEEKEKKKEEKKTAGKKSKEQDQFVHVMPPADAKPMCEGYLSKQTSATLGKRWKKKYFVLYAGQPRIHYYDSQSSVPSLAGVYCLLPSFLVQTVQKTKHTTGFPFLIKTPCDEYHLVAPTEGELRMWVTTLTRAITNLSNPQTAAEISVLQNALEHKIQTLEAEVEAVQLSYQAAKDEDTRTKALQRAEVLQSMIVACRMARQKLKKTKDQDDDDDTPPAPVSKPVVASTATTTQVAVDRSAASSSAAASAAAAATAAATAAAAAAAAAAASSGGASKPPVVRPGGKPPVVRPGGGVASPGVGGGVPTAAAAGGAAAMRPTPVGVAGGGMAAAGGMPTQLPPGVTMQQYQAYQQQLRYQQQLQYQQQMAARAQNPYGGWQ